MFSSQRRWIAAASIFVALMIAGCSSSSTSNPYPYGSGGSGGTSPTSTPSGATVVLSATATVGGKSETIFTDGRGSTLYYFDADAATQAACASGCTDTWPPLLAPSGKVQGPSGAPGAFTATNDGNGLQVEYQGHPLYLYSGDTAPGQTNGDGVAGQWHVATPNTPINTGGGGGY
jgi:predicted lipoprotein with Yx(FWY)xxD motif